MQSVMLISWISIFWHSRRPPVQLSPGLLRLLSLKQLADVGFACNSHDGYTVKIPWMLLDLCASALTKHWMPSGALSKLVTL